MNKLAQLNIPGAQVPSFPNLKPELATGNIGFIVSSLLDVVFFIAGFLMFIWALAGIFQYITSGGNKEGLAKARARITWAIVGFLIVVIAFSVSKYVKELVAPFDLPIQSVQNPTDNRGTPTCSGDRTFVPGRGCVDNP